MRDTDTDSGKEYSPTGPTSTTEESGAANARAQPLPALGSAHYTAPAPARPRPAPSRTPGGGVSCAPPAKEKAGCWGSEEEREGAERGSDGSALGAGGGGDRNV